MIESFILTSDGDGDGEIQPRGQNLRSVVFAESWTVNLDP